MHFNRKKLLFLKEKLSSGQSVLLLGPRQTGKSTLLEGLFDTLPPAQQIRYYLQLPSHRSEIEKDPETLLRAVDAKQQEARPTYLLIDEIQKVPIVMDVLQFLLDKRSVVVAATGSSARKLKRLGTNWLPGRIHLEYLFPLTWTELQLKNTSSELEQCLLYGMLPGIRAKENTKQMQEDLLQYTHLYLEEEIRMEAVVRNLPRFSQFLQLAALESGTSPNFSKIGSQVETSHTTIREYFQILEDSLIVHRSPLYGHSRDSVLRGPRFYFFDLGVRNAAARIGHSEGILTLQKGLLFEHFIVLELLARLRSVVRFFYWRTKQGEEVDLVLEKEGEIFLVEIKATKKPTTEDFNGFHAFIKKESKKPKAALLVCQIDVPQKFGPFLAVPWWEFDLKLSP